MPSPHTPKQNHFLTALPAEVYARLLPHLELIAMPLGWVLYESGAHLGYLYLPTTSIVSLLYVMENGASAEIAITGNDGWSAFRCSWVAKARLAGQWCKARATAID